jgi:hypothetical protein
MAGKVTYTHESMFIATRHNKEQVIAPIFQQVFDAKPFVSSFIDTNQFGTFTKEIERKDDPVKTLRKKCTYGNQLSACPYVIASEGSFGAHPAIPFANSNEEIVMFKDFKNDLEIIGRYLSIKTNLFDGQINTMEELEEAIAKINFPSHGLIVKDIEQEEVILKNINDHEQVQRFVRACLKSGHKLSVSSDMRAVNNPTRMQNIEKATQSLVENMRSYCPSCDSPGFVVKEMKPGLPCSSCGIPTRSILTAIKLCQKCNNKEELKYPNSKQFENPMYCDFCNP